MFELVVFFGIRVLLFGWIARARAAASGHGVARLAF
jgi:hypothetical protein